MADRTLDELLDALEDAAPSPAGGTAAAVTAAMAASLVAMVARGAEAWTEGAAIAERATTLRERLLTLGEEDVDAFAAVLRAYRSTGEDRPAALTAALIRASEVPLEIAERAAEVAGLAASAAQDGRGPMRLDAEAAAVLAEAATRAATMLVTANLSAIPDGREAEQVSRLLEAARRARQCAAGDSHHTS